MSKLTIKATIQAIRALGLTCGRTLSGEFRINFPKPHNTENNAYYTDDPQDAIGTAIAMRIIGTGTPNT